MASNKAKDLILLIVTTVTFVLVLFALNTITGPRIEANNNSAVYEPLFEVMPDAKGFTLLDVSAPSTVTSVWKETSSKGYVLQLSTNKGYTHEDILITVAISNDGKITGIKLVSYPETKDFGSGYPATYIGQDSSLSSVEIVAGVTYSSVAFKNAIADAFTALVDNNFIGAVAKEPSQIISEMIAVVNADMCSESGMIQAKVVEIPNTVKAWASDSGKSIALHLQEDQDYLAIVTSNSIVIYDLEAKDVTSEKASVVDAAQKAYQTYQDVLNEKDLAEISSLIEGSTGYKKLSVDAPDTILSVWEELSGLGYVVRVATNKGFTHEYINLSVAFTIDGKISNIVLETYPETRDFGPDYPATYIGQDSTLSGVEIVAGVTYSSVAFKNAVADAFTALTSNGLVVEAVKEPSQVIAEMLLEKAPALVNPQGILQAKELGSSTGVVKAWVNPENTVAAYWINSEGVDYLALVNSYESVNIYDLKGNDVTSEKSNVVSLALEKSSSILAKAPQKEINKIIKLLPENSVVTEVPTTGIYNSVSDIVKAETSEGLFYGMICHTYGFANHDMTYYIVFDQNDKIYNMNTSALIIEPEYFNVSVKKADYIAKLKGLDNSWTGEEALIAGATLTTDATKEAINDAFEVLSILRGGVN